MCSFGWDMPVVVFVVQQVISLFLGGQHSSPQANPCIPHMHMCCTRTEACMLDCIENTKSVWGWGRVCVCIDLSYIHYVYDTHVVSS